MTWKPIETADTSNVMPAGMWTSRTFELRLASGEVRHGFYRHADSIEGVDGGDDLVQDEGWFDLGGETIDPVAWRASE